MQSFLLSASAVLIITASLIYCVSILRGRTKPHRITRLVLFIVLTLNFISVLAANGNKGAVVYSGIAFVFGVIFFLLSLKRGMGGTTIFDWACFTLAMCGVIGWQITGNPLLGVWLATSADFVAYIPAFVKTWRYPNTETPWLYILSGLSAFLSLIAYKISAVSVFQIMIIGCCLIMLACIYNKRLFGFIFAKN